MASVVTTRHVRVCFCFNVSVNVHVEPAGCLASSSPVVSGRRLTRSQGAKTCVRIQKTPTHDLWQFVVMCIADGSPHLDPGLKTSCT